MEVISLHGKVLLNAQRCSIDDLHVFIPEIRPQRFEQAFAKAHAPFIPEVKHATSASVAIHHAYGASRDGRAVLADLWSHANRRDTVWLAAIRATSLAISVRAQQFL